MLAGFPLSSNKFIMNNYTQDEFEKCPLPSDDVEFSLSEDMFPNKGKFFAGIYAVC